MGKKQKQGFPKIAEAILSGDVAKAKTLLVPDMIFKTVLLKKGKNSA